MAGSPRVHLANYTVQQENELQFGSGSNQKIAVAEGIQAHLYNENYTGFTFTGFNGNKVTV
jgi:hypothetical protein